MNDAILISLYSVAVVASSLFGGWLPSLFRLTHVRMQVMLSFVGGMMLGVGLLHMLPHANAELGSLDTAIAWMLVGLLGMFLLIRTFHFHEHAPAAPETETESPGHDPSAGAQHAGHGVGCNHSGGTHSEGTHPGEEHPGEAHPGEEHEEHGSAMPLSSLSWIGVASGLSLHAFLDGIALGAGVISDTTHRGGTGTGWAGFGVFVAILLHKPLDALSITTLMQARQWSRRSQQVVNAGFAMMCPLGAWGFAIWVHHAGGAQHQLVGIALAISAGVFLCISLSDLLPEVQFHRHDRLKLSAALILGVLSAYAIRYFEPAHAHGPDAHAEHASHSPIFEAQIPQIAAEKRRGEVQRR